MPRQEMITSDTDAALSAIGGKLGKSRDRLREQFGNPDMSDADLIDTIKSELELGFIWVEGEPGPLSEEELTWLAGRLFRVNEDGRLLRGQCAGVLPLPDANGKIPGILAFDAASFRSGDKLSVEDQRAAVADYIRPSATWCNWRYVRATE